MKFTRDSFLSLVKEIIKEERFSQIPHKKNQWVSFDSSDLNSNKSSDIDITDEIVKEERNTHLMEESNIPHEFCVLQLKDAQRVFPTVKVAISD